MKIIALSGNVKKPSRTASLVGIAADRLRQRIGGQVQSIELVDAAPVLFRALRADQLDTEGKAIIATVEDADVIVVGSPVYRASYSGALKHLFDLVDYRALAGKRVILIATGGTPLHGLMLEHQLRPLFGFFNALTVPTAIYALEADFTDYELTNPEVLERVDRAIEELAAITPLANSTVTPAGTHGGLAA
ncbi:MULTISPECIES: FMN reductase [Agrobacterium]|uniref:FMN reductase n=1 Tax=Agrobacterium tumefaciens TaxID=358 RepID=A0AAE6EGU8_AGRTU|nr:MULTISPECIES: FMN reductase [Agrobacterium]QCL76238.1 FMN reductase [Agrobacterium tumefaciens]QCL81754.1 FMN reductase [Agrobacterium tumefaciens]WCK05056.1 FMN reductase [Agrobacterium tumefaciens]CUX68373.1 FMN reductase (NADPH) [Agrobacterium sp. NCPPB 925]